MGTFRRVDAEQAGPEALGILVPPSRRTFVILRPRALGWDLLLCRDDFAFRELAHDEASAAAQGLFKALRGGATVEAIGERVRVTTGHFVLVACARRPGRPYTPLICGAAEAAAVVGMLAGVLCPADGAEQELYFNTRFFGRQEPGD